MRALPAAPPTEDVPEHLVEDVPEPLTTAEPGAVGIDPCVTKLVVSDLLR